MHIKVVYLIAAVVLLSACVTEGGRVPDNIKASAINVQLGMGYLQQNNLQLASQKLNKALDQDPNSASAHNAYAILQERLLQVDKAEFHYQRATEIDPDNSEAANNYGAFLCRNKREEDSEAYFLKALKNPLYKTPEFAYTNAAICLMRIEQRKKARGYLQKALAVKGNFSTALISLAKLEFDEDNFPNSKLYLDRFHRVAVPTASSLWLAIRAELQMDSQRDVTELSQELKSKFPDSEEYKSWLKIQ